MLTLKERRGLLSNVLSNKNSDFYKKFYNTKVIDEGRILSIKTEEDWRALPILTKDDLLECTLQERSFIPLSEIDHIRGTSGTSGKAPLFCPRTDVRNMDYRLTYHDFKGGVLAFGVPMIPHWHEKEKELLGHIPHVVTLDPSNLEASVRLAATVHVDSISTFVFHMRPIGEAMKKIGTNTDIKFIELGGDVCSQAMYEYMKETFPNATIVQLYGCSEVEDVPMGVPCRAITGEEPLSLYHAKESHFLEILDIESGEIIEPTPGVEGNLVITTYPGEPSSFPLLRFDMGDMIRVVDDKCSHGLWTFTVLGRTNFDFLKIEGGILRSDEVRRVLRLIKEVESDEFQIHRYEVDTPHGPRTQVELHVEISESANMEALALIVADEMRIGPEKTYNDGVLSGAFMPLVCKKMDTHNPLKKHKRMISHA